jgi:hypothetical protein
MHEKRSNFSRLSRRIEKCRVAIGPGVTAEKSGSPTPSTAGRDLSRSFDDEVRAVLNELGVDAKGALERGLNLLRGVIGRTK